MMKRKKICAGALVLGLAAFVGSSWACGGIFCLKKNEAGSSTKNNLAAAGNSGTDRYASAEKSDPTKKNNEKWITLKVEGMTCSSCEFNVKRALKKVDGVMEASASTKEGEARVLYDTGKAKPADLVKAVDKIGYKASLPVPSGAPDSAAGG